jgi:phage baseplate assembly protein V
MSVADRLYRRVMNMVATVKITATDDTGPVHRAQVRGFPPETIDNMPVLQIYGLASHAMPGSDATALFTSGDRSNGTIIATGNQQYRLRNLKSGEVALYDNGGNIVKLANGGNIEITCPHGITIKCDTLAINADSSITLTSPKVTVKSPNFSSGA